ncbi:hypothetical protein RFI_01063 [Reticulomyxa filosa]|uniref:Protein kinase domain-containing protein n=1 Tax=Reticulomyxa filosa TaxID=46433 RepID=X6PD17_RETFI|nr:hypothetical protein RFI_01063 [Reticulomyxa filosa]|eukprot:ETO35998.1 hypothetical protein RFI_01063 [Reticulomyxa filosa]
MDESVLDILMNLLFLLPTFFFLLVYMILCCIWMEITLFSRDQFILTREDYSKIWRRLYFTIFVFMLVALVVTFVICMQKGSDSDQLASALFRSVWVMQLFIPTCAVGVYIFLIVRFAGFPFLNEVWKQQAKQMNLVVAFWTLGDLLEGTMLSIWANNTLCNWDDNKLAFQISVVLTTFCCEMLPVLYVTDWNVLGFLVIAFDHWRNLFVGDSSQAISPNDPLLRYSKRAVASSASSLNSKRVITSLNGDDNNYDDNDNDQIQGHLSPDEKRDHGKEEDEEDIEQIISAGDIVNSNPRVHKLTDKGIYIYIYIYLFFFLMIFILPSLPPRKPTTQLSVDWTTLKIKETLAQIPEYSTHRAVCGDREVCLKLFHCQSSVPKTLLNQTVNDIIARYHVKHEYLASLYAARVVCVTNNCSVEILTKWYSKGSLYDIIVASPKQIAFSLKVVCRVALQLAEVLKFIHNQLHTCHGFVKSKNILFDDSMNVKLTDFGLISLKHTMQVMMSDIDFDGYWCDPSYFSEGSPLSPFSDIWAYGFVLHQLVSKKIPYAEFTTEETKKQVIAVNVPVIPTSCPLFLQNCPLQKYTIEIIIDNYQVLEGETRGKDQP